MKCKLYSVEDNQYENHQNTIEQSGGWWVRFGSEVFVYVADKKASESFAALSNRSGLTLVKDLPDAKKGDTFLVEQKGRIFQLEHPTIDIIHDQGRYLIATVPKDDVEQLQEEQRTCFRLTPLQENTVVFDIVSNARKRGTGRANFNDDFNPLDANSFATDLVTLTSWRTRLSNSPEFLQAAQWASTQLQSLGLRVTIEPFTFGSNRKSYNVIASKPGNADNGGSLLVVGAHLDSINHIDGESGPAPGADDNASGAAGVLALARWVAAREFNHTVSFVLFGGEEQGLFGSQQYVNALSSKEKPRIVGMLNMDMIGSLNEERASVLLEGAVLSQSMIDTLSASAIRYTDLVVETSLNPFASDHVPFIEAGIPAVLTIEGADSANGRVHTANDTLDFLNHEFALDILNIVAASLDHWLESIDTAGPTTTPCTDCTDTEDPAIDAQRQLLVHYQQLLATYARLYENGQLASDLYHSYLSAWSEYQQLLHSEEPSLT